MSSEIKLQQFCSATLKAFKKLTFNRFEFAFGRTQSGMRQLSASYNAIKSANFYRGKVFGQSGWDYKHSNTKKQAAAANNHKCLIPVEKGIAFFRSQLQLKTLRPCHNILHQSRLLFR